MEKIMIGEYITYAMIGMALIPFLIPIIEELILITKELVSNK